MYTMATAVGLRQRWLLGRYEGEKYPKLLAQSKKVIVKSTNTARTIQCAYAELAGANYALDTASRFTLT